MVLHGLIQYALKTANQSPYSIKHASDGWFHVWKHMGGGSWIITAKFTQRQDAVDFVAWNAERGMC